MAFSKPANANIFLNFVGDEVFLVINDKVVDCEEIYYESLYDNDSLPLVAVISHVSKEVSVQAMDLNELLAADQLFGGSKDFPLTPGLVETNDGMKLSFETTQVDHEFEGDHPSVAYTTTYVVL